MHHSKRRFSLRWFFWLTLCAALACWLLRLPPLVVEQYTVLLANGEPHTVFHAPLWNAEVWLRLFFCLVLLMTPTLVVRFRRHRTVLAAVRREKVITLQ